MDSESNIVDSIKYNLHFTSDGKWDDTPSSISAAGFSGDDITNRRKRLTSSFLRLSFYDSDNLKTQNLLYTSTLLLYMKMKDCTRKICSDERPVVSNVAVGFSFVRPSK